MAWHPDTSAEAVTHAEALARIAELAPVAHAVACLRADGWWDVLVEHDEYGKPVLPPALRHGSQRVGARVRPDDLDVH
jgi:hypothetical protein